MFLSLAPLATSISEIINVEHENRCKIAGFKKSIIVLTLLYRMTPSIPLYLFRLLRYLHFKFFETRNFTSVFMFDVDYLGNGSS